MNKVFENTIFCGFILDYCESVYNAENIRYIIEVIMYKTSYQIDINKWDKNWEEIDKEYEGYDESKAEEKEDWPSTKVNQVAVREHLQFILDSFIQPNGPNAVSIDSNLAQRIHLRSQRLQRYGPYVFDESLLDHVMYVYREIRPMFIKSPHFAEMRRRMKDTKFNATLNQFQIPYPAGSLISYSTLQDFPDERRFNLEEILSCELLFGKFLKYTERNFTSENLLCFRYIVVFKYRKERKLSGIDESWDIYNYFIAPKSLYEISVRADIRKNIELQLAKPRLETYDAVLKSVHTVIKQDFQNYTQTSEYESLSEFLRYELKTSQQQKANRCLF